MNEFNHLEDVEIMAGHRKPADLTRLKLKCLDGGVCNHNCLSNAKEVCFRQACCGPFGNTTWEEINELKRSRRNGADTKSTQSQT